MGVLALDRFPETREEYDTLLRAKGFTQYQAGYLFHEIVDGWQQIRKDLAVAVAEVGPYGNCKCSIEERTKAFGAD